MEKLQIALKELIRASKIEALTHVKLMKTTIDIDSEQEQVIFVSDINKMIEELRDEQ